MPMSLIRTLLIPLVPTLIAGCAGIPVHQDRSTGEPEHTIHLVRHGWHTGIIVRSSDIPESVWPEIADFPDAEYLEVGWGDHEFYPSPDPSNLDALRAVLGPGPSVLHIVGLSDHPTRVLPYGDLVALEIGDPGFRRLIEFIAATHERNATERAEPIGPGLYLDSRFYPAQGRFHLFNNCNTWVVNALRTAGLPLRVAITSEGVIRQGLEFGTPLRASSKVGRTPNPRACRRASNRSPRTASGRRRSA